MTIEGRTRAQRRHVTVHRELTNIGRVIRNWHT